LAAGYPEIKAAAAQRDIHGISDRDFQAWRAQWHSAKRRGIPFRFTLLGWVLWWHGELARIGDGAARGRRHGQYVMGRIGDSGAYEPGNVLAMPPHENARQRTDRAVVAATAKTTAARAAKGTPRGYNLRVRGDGHPKSRAILTPAGRFGSIALAAEHYGLTRQGAGLRAREGRQGWSYEGTTAP
jgi:hypothetical protein